jgi:predicted ATP-grasp superfamily ATP-dependent carboligase
MTDEGVVLLIGSGVQRYREYLLAGAARDGRRIWLIESSQPTWQQQYLVGSSVVPLRDPARLTPDLEGLLAAALELAQRQRIAGVYSYDEILIVSTAHIAQALGLPGATIDGVENCRNKQRNRQVLTAAGVPQPRFTMVRTLDEARAAAERTGYPVVLKPQGMGASIGVVRVDEGAGLAEAFEVAFKGSYGGNPDYEGGVLVEEMVSGPEISVDGAIVDGEYIPLFLARKTVGLPPFFEEVGHVVDPGDPLLSDPALADVLVRAHQAVGMRYGMTHTEVMLTQRGPVVIEVNGRLGGDLIPYLGKLATGIDPGAVAAEVALGRKPDVTPSEHRVVGIRFAYPPEDCRVVEISVPAPGSMPGLLESAAMVGPGRELRLPPKGYLGRYAYAICTAPDPQACNDALDAALAQGKLSYAEPSADPGELMTR